jgi:hypothetical protein
MLPVELKVAVERPDERALMKFGHANETSVGIRHGTIAVSLHERLHARVFLRKVELHPEKSRVYKPEEIIGIVPVALQEEERFGNDSFAGEHRGRRFFALLDGPGVPVIVADEKRDERAGIDQPA